MSLRFRLIGLVALVLVASLAFGGLIACFNASRSVRTEMRSALLVARQIVDNTVRGMRDAPDPQRRLDDFVALFQGNRHLRVAVTGGTVASTAPVADRSPLGAVPAWFVRLVGVPSVTEQVPVTVDGRPYGAVVIETDPRNEILEVWNEASESLVALALFSGLTILLIHLFIGRALRPLDRLAAGLEEIARGDYRTRIRDRLTPELSRLRDSFNRMAARLADVDADNRRLNGQLLTLQEQERSDIARDLHDEVSPFLFAINIDLANIARLAAEERLAELPAHLQSVGEAVRHMQGQVRSMLGRLRPIGLAEFGLGDAIGGMIEFWRRRHPGIAYRLEVGAECEGLGDLADTTIYRIAQEALSNAVRHGNPAVIALLIAQRRNAATGQDEVTVEVADDGDGMRDPSAIGYGLLGMSERVRAMGGHLAFGNREGGGFAVTAVLPCAASRSAVADAAP
jgi:two-component system, NarL family, sensor histidine kinase UhpB